MRKAGWLAGIAALVLVGVLVLRGAAPANALRQAINNTPTISTIGAIVQEQGSTGTVTAFTVNDADVGQTLTISILNAPAGWTIQTAPTSVVSTGSAQAINLDVEQPNLPTGAPQGTYQFTVRVEDDGAPPASAQTVVTVFVVSPGLLSGTPPTPTATPTPSATPTVSPTASVSPTITATGTTTPTPTTTLTVTPFPTFAPPTITPTLTPTFIPALATRTPLPRPANAGQAVPLNPARVRFVVNRDGVNVRIIPEIGAPLAGIVNSGYTALAEAISGNGEWLRFNFEGNDAWIGFPTISVIEGDINALSVQDPRTIPYGGFESPRAGLTSVTSPNQGRLEFSGLRVRGGPGLGYPVLANAPRYTVFSLLGRNEQGSWVQVNFEGTLGWIASQYMQFTTVGGLNVLPIGGIVADALPVSERTFDSYTDTLRLLLSRIEIALAPLEQIRAIWTGFALGGNLQCGTYPFQPTDYNIPNPVLAAFFGTLDPLQTDFNAAMGSLRQAIDLLIDACNGRRVPAETVNQALDLINQVDGLFGSLRARLIELIPPEFEFDPNTACLFTFNNRSEVVPRLIVNTVASVRFDRETNVGGFCFDGEAGRSFKLEVLAFQGNPQPSVSVSPFDNPTSFISVGSASGQRTLVTLAPILIPATGRYLVIIADTDGAGQEVLEGEIAVLLTDVTAGGATGAQNLSIDANGNLVVAPVPNQSQLPVFTPVPGGVPGAPVQGTPVAGVNPAFCPNITYTCTQIQAVGGTCNTALSCLAAGNTSLDPDFDGIACETVLCPGN
ncbi:MAG: SH3 domain-containing protein [bacterium]|nr:SH3 domain-containing protein [bacterium]